MPTEESEMMVSAPVKSAWNSKVNWAGAIIVLASVLKLIGIDLDTETQGYITAIITGVAGVAVWYFRTFKTKALTKGSVDAP